MFACTLIWIFTYYFTELLISSYKIYYITGQYLLWYSSSVNHLIQCIQKTVYIQTISHSQMYSSEARHMNKHKYLLCLGFPLPCTVINGPTATFANALNGVVNLFNSSGAIICWATVL